MNQTVVGFFDNIQAAQQASAQLIAAGFTQENVDISSGGAATAGGSTNSSNYQNTSGTTTEAVGDAAGRTGDSVSNFFSNLFGGDDTEDARRYSHVARQGHSILTVHCQSAEHAHRAAEILDNAGAVDVDERAAQTGYAGANNLQAGATTGQEGLSAQVIEENLQVGKRVEQTGGARLRSRIVERPVEASVRLREEHVSVERHPVNRPATEADFNAFKEGEIEITESAERAVVGKEARVVEEVTLGKEVTEREETIRDTVRKTEVDVERINDATTQRSGYTTDEEQRRNS
ncbi:YsnF/AvaK domain-containing protein [Hymenobacter cellulosilyticus]|uniref:YsnF/AvaK domain-containing protein n=1 Tax=Hymenobacter cellulosilyticus TaxID=2932248 RepID=A0A8T9Q9N2_9BACT|nr:YsnF/AvaK domain-containing protein [Hymenobacter cellulosilyticus]UOQ72219.1 YsnF/AvaK domain-containing protein [Hymenobacter cellulosilyticus]